MSLSLTFHKIVADNGEDILDDHRRVGALLADLSPNTKALNNVLETCLRLRIHERLLQTAHPDYDQLADFVNNQTGASIDMVRDALQIIASLPYIKSAVGLQSVTPRKPATPPILVGNSNTQGNAASPSRASVTKPVGVTSRRALTWVAIAAVIGSALWVTFFSCNFLIPRAAASMGMNSAQWYMVEGYRHGFRSGVKKDPEEEQKWLKRYSETANAAQTFDIAEQYKHGTGVPKDPAVADYWFKAAAERGHDLAQVRLGQKYEAGEGVPKSYLEAARWYTMAAAQGNAVAQYNLANLYSNGQGVLRNAKQAAKWYRAAAEQGHLEAQINLGFQYGTGKGVEQDYAEAARWFRAAAEQGSAIGQYNLGYLYRYGKGVPKDLGEAARWYKLAADQGDYQAEVALRGLK